MSRITIRSERDAWEHVKRRAEAAQRRGITVEECRALFIECDAIADTMLAQLFEGVHKNPKSWKPSDDGITDEEFVYNVNRLGIVAVAAALRRNQKTIKAAYDRLRRTGRV